MKTKKRKLGDRAEDLVVKYARRRGWKILARNWSKPWGEIDIVARKSSSRLPFCGSTTILFIEVKAQSAPSPWFKPEDHFNFRKRERLTRTCQSYLLEHGYGDDTDYRIDLAAVEMSHADPADQIRYYENV